jgi:hypothetical protein
VRGVVGIVHPTVQSSRPTPAWKFSFGSSRSLDDDGLGTGGTIVVVVVVVVNRFLGGDDKPNGLWATKEVPNQNETCEMALFSPQSRRQRSLGVMPRRRCCLRVVF